ncbi:hypothetical protein AMIS_33430 [Actinoplanes missouriensis 431]|uniref:Uncharacterized protein n=1 Tax=Actinoplanes missouriensis (strain ATCC 14538 / DSM 43046 / CBS 188.64 / JCM 3121 / NBRC 102363 / NCIMB 12654 / NRRL B-3342 / UNCC 431) TaxID=512565 RepID=I0H6C6_ACTM4|nr:hypothetical protein [Actinoplanes missouriensis]BAL88563.1 hypothetical protein AMIS_33430 [Actinoplanes missouriensis 431]
MRAIFAARYASGPPTLRGWLREPGSITSLQVLVVLLAVLPGVAVAVLGVALVDNLTPSERVPAVITALDNGFDKDSSDYRWASARADDGRALGLGAGAPAGYGEPVVVTLSTVTGRLVAIRAAGALYQPHRTNEYLFLVVLLLGVLVVAALIARRMARMVPWTLLLAAAVAGFAGVGGWQLASTAAIADAPRLPPSTGMGIYTEARFAPATRAATGQPVAFQDVTLRVTGPVTRGAPAGSAPWLGDFTVLTVPFSASSTGAPGGRYVPLTLIGSGSGTAERIAARHCGPGGFDGQVPAGSVEGRMCFVVPPDFQPRQVIVGTGEVTGIDVAAAAG